MALCVNQSGTWRNITTQCVNESGTWRNVVTGCINQSGTWRCFGFLPPLGAAFEGGYLIYKSSGTAWIVAPNTSEVVRVWTSRNDAVTAAQSVSGCTGWFVPTYPELQNIGYTCRTYWDSYSNNLYWSSTEWNPTCAWAVCFYSGSAFAYTPKTNANHVRALRCVSY